MGPDTVHSNFGPHNPVLWHSVMVSPGPGHGDPGAGWGGQLAGDFRVALPEVQSPMAWVLPGGSWGSLCWALRLLSPPPSSLPTLRPLYLPSQKAPFSFCTIHFTMDTLFKPELKSATKTLIPLSKHLQGERSQAFALWPVWPVWLFLLLGTGS
jgi:hypothetical protein